jgi:TatD DNase family protein
MFFPFRNHTYRFLDVHTHRPLAAEKTLAVKNIFAHELLNHKFEFKEDFYYSIGLHPWHIQEADLKREMKILIDYALHPQVLAIGEAGLDRCINTDWRVQTNIFFKHAELAEAVNKPLIIHCVRAYPEMIALKKQIRPTSAWVLHGYQANANLTEQLIKNQFLLSFGEILLKPKMAIHSIFANLPADSFFLETDATESPIEQVFARAAELRNIGEDDLQNQVFANFKQWFWAE